MFSFHNGASDRDERVLRPMPRYRCSFAKAAFVALTFTLARAAPAHADDAEANLEKARQLFTEGTERVKNAEWSPALASFEQSAALKPHAITTYNIGACQRAIGSYTRARATFAAALARHETTRELPDSLATAAKGFIDEIDRLIAHAKVKIAPADARIAVDGAPLTPDPSGGGRLIAGLAAPGPGQPPPSASFELLLDPGVHVIVLSRKGFSDIVLNRTLAPSSTVSLTLELDKLPGVMHIASNQERAVVTVAGLDVGMTPAHVTRAAGSYHVVVKKEGFLPYESQVALKAGDDLSLRAELTPESKPLYKRWWFWTGAAAVLTAVAVGTYFAARPEPTRPPLDGGGLGWSVPVE
jgi:hypothetical protein